MSIVASEPSVVSVPSPTARPASAVPHPTSCPSWCKDRHAPFGHHFGPTQTAHWSRRYVLPGEGCGVLAQAELARVDCGDRMDEEVLYVSGETHVELSPEEADIFIVQAQAWVDALRVLRQQMS